MTGWLLTDPESSGHKGRQAQRLAAELLGKDDSPELASPEDVLHYLRGRRENVGLVSYALDDAGDPVEPAVRHRERKPAPLASAIKIVHLAAYAAAVGAGRLDPAERVSLGPAADGVTLDQLVSAMIEESDNAAADHLRERLGEPALIAAAGKAGGPALKSLPSFADQAAGAGTAAMLAPATLAALLAAIASDRYVSPEVSAIARRHLEWPAREWPSTDGIKALGTKGGSLPGVLSEAGYAVAADGGIRVTVLSLRGMPGRAWTSALRSQAVQRFTVRLAADPAFLKRVRAELD